MPDSTNTLEQTTHSRLADLTSADIADMRALLERHFDGVAAEQFEKDLMEKTDVLRVWRAGRLAGFSTLLACREQIDGEWLNLLYSGDTIMSPDCWGSPVLARAWIAMVKKVVAAMPSGRCFWLLLSSGFRTYRFLPVFWRHFWPRHDSPMPEDIRHLRDEISRRRFGGCFDAQAGVVRFQTPHRLRGPLAVVPAGRAEDAHIAFFLHHNPGWQAGDELVCLTEICDDNLTAAGRRMTRDLPV